MLVTQARSFSKAMDRIMLLETIIRTRIVVAKFMMNFKVFGVDLLVT